MPKLIKKYSLGAGIPSAAFNFAAISNLAANQNVASTTATPPPLPPIDEVSSYTSGLNIDLDAGINIPNSDSISYIEGIKADVAKDFAKRNPRFAVDREIANKANNGGWDFDPNEIKRRQLEINYKNQLKGYGIQMMGRQLGESIGGDWGDVIGQTAGNFGDIIGNGGSLKDFTKASNLGNLGASIGTSVLDRHTAHSRYSGKHGDLAGGIDLVAGIFGGNPYASLGMAAINKVTGGTDGMTTQDALLGSNAVAGALFAVNPALGAAYMGVSALNSATGKTTQKFKGNDLESQEARAALGGSYGKTQGDLDAAQNRSGKKYGGISRLTGQYQRANRIVGEGNDYMASLNDIYGRRQLGLIRGQNMADINNLDYRLNTFGGYDLYGTVIGRKGMKLPTLQDIQGVRNIIKMQRGRKYNGYHTGDYCEYPDCATFSNRTVRDLKDPATGKNYTSYGDAWALNDVDVVYNGYDILHRPSGKNLNEIKMYNFNAADNLKRNFNSSTLDKNQVYLVNMFFKPTPHWNDAFNNGTRGVAGTHAGYLYYDGDKWMVAHNIHHKIHVDPFLSVQGSGGLYGVTSIFKPLVGKGRKTGLFGLGWGIFGEGGVINSFKKGGQMNVIPEGALHARLHHMETENKITKKGIPVIDKHGELQAEIERNEIIFSLEVTNKLEELRKDGSDKAALEAGKLLVDEIFHNTDDRTGLIQEIIGTDEAKKGVFKEGGIIAEMPNFAIQAEEPEIEKFQDGGIIAEEPEMDSDEDEPVGIEEVEYFQTGGIIAEEPNGSDDEEEDIEEYLKGKKIKYPHWDESMMPSKKPKFEEWIKDVNPDFNSPNYDLEAAYEIYPFELLERWKWATRQSDPNYYLNYLDENGNYIYHLNSIAEMPNGEYMFLKKGTERTNPEIEGELAAYYSGENGLLDTHDLKFDYKTNRYYYRHKLKHQEGGIIEQLNKLSPDKLKELENILKYLNK